MYIFKMGLVLLIGAGFGFGVDKLSESEMFSNDNGLYSRHMEEDGYYGHMREVGCHRDGELLEHMLENLTEEDLVLVQGKIDALLVEESISLEDLNYDFDVRYNFMTDLMDFLEENEIEFHTRRGYHYDDEDNWHGGMRMH